jgi:hypothetical protein
MFAISVTADAGGVLIAVCFLAMVVVLFWRRNGKVETRLGSIEVGVEQINRQVNHVADDAVPTVREDVIDVRDSLTQGGAVHAMLCEVRVDVAEMKRDLKRVDRRVGSVEAAQLAAGERLGEVGSLSRKTADLLGSHLEDRP